MAVETVSTSDFSGFLTAEMAQPYFDQAYRLSVVQQATREVPLGINGQSIPVVTSRMSASWVSEGGLKPASKGTQSLKSITPKKLAAIAVVSAEVVRANPGGFMDSIRPQIAEAFASAFDAAVLHGTSTPFASYIDQTTKAVELGSNSAAAGGVWQDLNSALRLLVTSGKRLTGWVLDDVVEPLLNGSVDANGRPIFVDVPTGEDTAAMASGVNADKITRIGRLMSRPSFMNSGIGTTNETTVVGYAGDWSQCIWGKVGGISYDVSNQATVTIDGTLTSLWEHNLVAIRAEAEYGFLCNDTSSFVRLTNLIGS